MDKTIAAISTNSIGVGAINIIRLSGKDAIKIVSKVFTNKAFSEAPSHTIHYGFIKDDSTIIDEVLVMLMKAPKTYTKEDIVEINCHGGYITTNNILKLLLKNGAVLAEPGEFTKRAFLNGRINLMEAESISDLIEAKTEKATSMALNGLEGKTSELIRNIREELVSLLSNIEVNIDYPEYTDELVITRENIKPILSNIKERVTTLIKESKNGLLIKNGLNIALVGRPNTGKSSLLNALLEQDKAIVTNIKGTTRDIVEGSIIYKGINLNFTDTAGIRKTSDIIEEIGVQKSLEALKKADLVILVLSNNEELSNEDKELYNIVKEKKHMIFINKIDLEKKLEFDYQNEIIIEGSAKNNLNINLLKDKILEVFSLEELDNKDLIYLSNFRQISLAEEALRYINSALKNNEDSIPIDMISIDIKSCWEVLGKIIGESYEDELVDNIFKRFCLGK